MVHEHTYTNDLCNKRVLICGSVPPPYGGVSVHIQRSIYKLEQQNNIITLFDPDSVYLYPWMRHTIYKYGAFSWYIVRMLRIIMLTRPQVVIYHISYARQFLPELMLLTTLKSIYQFQLILVDHDCRHMALRSEAWIQRYIRYLKRVDMLILIGSITAHSYMMRGITDTCATRIESAFLPPDITKRDTQLTGYPKSLIDFLQSHCPRIIMNAYQCVVWNGADLYGIDQALYASQLLKKMHPNTGLIILLSTIGDQAQYVSLLNLINSLQLADHVYLLQGNYQLWPLFFHTDLFIRPTQSDGASVSVQEALYCKIPVVASDVCWRPLEVVTYQTGSLSDLHLKMDTIFDTKGTIHADKQHHYLHPQSSP